MNAGVMMGIRNADLPTRVPDLVFPLRAGGNGRDVLEYLDRLAPILLLQFGHDEAAEAAQPLARHIVILARVAPESDWL